LPDPYPSIKDKVYACSVDREDFDRVQLQDIIFYRSPNYPRSTTDQRVRYKGVILDAFGEIIKVRCLGRLWGAQFTKDWQGTEEYINREDIIKVVAP
jgi:hypothetical protein